MCTLTAHVGHYTCLCFAVATLASFDVARTGPSAPHGRLDSEGTWAAETLGPEARLGGRGAAGRAAAHAAARGRNLLGAEAVDEDGVRRGARL